MEEPAGVPSARCKTSLASAYGLMSEVSPAFTLPASPLVRSLLDDTNLALTKFLEDQTVHGFLPVPGHWHRWYYRTSSSSFPGPYTLPPGVTSITLEKVSEAKNILLLCPPHRSPRWRPCFLVCVRSRPGWTGGCRPAGVFGIIYLSRCMSTSRG